MREMRGRGKSGSGRASEARSLVVPDRKGARPDCKLLRREGETTHSQLGTDCSYACGSPLPCDYLTVWTEDLQSEPALGPETAPRGRLVCRSALSDSFLRSLGRYDSGLLAAAFILLLCAIGGLRVVVNNESIMQNSLRATGTR